MNSYHKYLSDNGRILITTLDLSHLTSDGTVQTASIPEQDWSQINDCPNMESATLVWSAINAMRSELKNHQKYCSKPVDHIGSLAHIAAEEHERCLREQKLNPFTLPKYAHFCETDKQRYAVSVEPIRYAAADEAPSIILESNLKNEDLSQICFVTDLELACFLRNATRGTWHSPAELIGHTVKRPSHYHNTAILANSKIWLNDGNRYFPLDDANLDQYNAVLRILLYDLQYQIAICRFFRKTKELAFTQC